MGSWRKAGWVFAAVLVIELCLLPFVDQPRNDGQTYMLQAEAPFHFIHAPWGFRFLAPLIAWALPVSARVGLAAITFVSIAGTAAALSTRAPHWFVLFSAPAAWVLIRSPQFVSGLALFCMALALLLAERNRWLAASLVVAVGVCGHEQVGFVLLPLVALAWLRHRPRREMVALVGLPVAVLAIVHFTPLLWGEIPSAGGALAFAKERETLGQYGGHMRVLLSAAVLYAPSLLLLASAWRRLTAEQRAVALILVPCLGMALISTDPYRLMAPVVLVTVPCLAIVRPRWLWWAGAVVMPFLILDVDPSPWKWAAELALLAGCVVGILLGRSRMAGTDTMVR